MGVWFDNLARDVASRKLSRRAALGYVFGVGAGTGSQFFGSTSSLGAPTPTSSLTPSPLVSVGLCKFAVQGSQRTISFSFRASIGGKEAVFVKSLSAALSGKGETTSRNVISNSVSSTVATLDQLKARR